MKRSGNMEPTELFSFRIKMSSLKRLQELAAESNRSMSFHVNEIIRKALERAA
jgi:predicted DNA-binding protein